MKFSLSLLFVLKSFATCLACGAFKSTEFSFTKFTCFVEGKINKVGARLRKERMAPKLDARLDIIGRIATLGLGVLCVYLVSESYNSNSSKDVYYFSIGIIAIIISSLLFIIVLFNLLPDYRPLRMDAMGDVILGFLLFIGDIIFSQAVHDHWSSHDEKENACRVISLIFGFLNTALYFGLGVIKLMNRCKTR